MKNQEIKMKETAEKIIGQLHYFALTVDEENFGLPYNMTGGVHEEMVEIV